MWNLNEAKNVTFNVYFPVRFTQWPGRLLSNWNTVTLCRHSQYISNTHSLTLTLTRTQLTINEIQMRAFIGNNYNLRRSNSYLLLSCLELFQEKSIHTTNERSAGKKNVIHKLASEQFFQFSCSCSRCSCSVLSFYSDLWVLFWTLLSNVFSFFLVFFLLFLWMNDSIIWRSHCLFSARSELWMHVGLSSYSLFGAFFTFQKMKIISFIVIWSGENDYYVMNLNNIIEELCLLDVICLFSNCKRFNFSFTNRMRRTLCINNKNTNE